ncbi:MAG: glycine/sarcosine/betaine reductase component B subunit [bacterium]
MRLEIESIDIKKIQTGSKTQAQEGVLSVNLEELEERILQDPRIRSVDLHLVSPGENVRILNLMDVIQPRCKIDKTDADFPGFIGKMQIAGSGRTRSLQNIAVLVSNPCTNRKENGVLDMAGPIAEMSPYGKMNNIVVAPRIAAGIEERDFENAVKAAGLRTAVYLARGADRHPASQVEVYDLDIPHLDRKSNLPRVACYYQLYSPQFDHRAISDACFYGTDVRHLMPTVVHPNEILDGGVVGWLAIKALDTYSIQNHGVVKELYRHHGRDLNFAGVVCTVANMEPAARARSACMAANLVKNVLGADGVILVKITGGMPHIDLAMTGEECEKLGVKTAIFTQPLTPFGTLADTILFNQPALDCIITSSATFERTKIPWKAEKFLGGTAETKIFCPDPIDQSAGDPVIDIEEYLLPGVLDCTGSARVIVKEY